MIIIIIIKFSVEPLIGYKDTPENEECISLNQDTMHGLRKVYKTTPEMRVPPLIMIIKTVSRVSCRNRGVHCTTLLSCHMHTHTLSDCDTCIHTHSDRYTFVHVCHVYGNNKCTHKCMHEHMLNNYVNSITCQFLSQGGIQGQTLCLELLGQPRDKFSG